MSPYTPYLFSDEAKFMQMLLIFNSAVKAAVTNPGAPTEEQLIRVKQSLEKMIEANLSGEAYRELCESVSNRTMQLYLMSLIKQRLKNKYTLILIWSLTLNIIFLEMSFTELFSLDPRRDRIMRKRVHA